MIAFEFAYDIYKHLITLDTGAIVLLIGLVEKLYPNPIKKGAMVISLISFVVSIFGSLVMLVIIITDMGMGGGFGSNSIENFAGLLGTLTAWGGFLMGVLSLVFFGIKNLYSSNA